MLSALKMTKAGMVFSLSLVPRRIARGLVRPPYYATLMIRKHSISAQPIPLFSSGEWLELGTIFHG